MRPSHPTQDRRRETDGTQFSSSGTQRLQSLTAVSLAIGSIVVGLMVGCAPSAKPEGMTASHSAADRGRYLASCLAEKGFPATVEEDGSLSSTITPEQLSERRVASDECTQSALERYPMPAETDEFKRALYAEELAVVDCLRSHGVIVDSTPSLQTYVDSYSGPDRWSAWADITPDKQPDLFSEEGTAVRDLAIACPNPLSQY